MCCLLEYRELAPCTFHVSPRRLAVGYITPSLPGCNERRQPLHAPERNTQGARPDLHSRLNASGGRSPSAESAGGLQSRGRASATNSGLKVCPPPLAYRQLASLAAASHVRWRPPAARDVWCAIDAELKISPSRIRPVSVGKACSRYHRCQKSTRLASRCSLPPFARAGNEIASVRRRDTGAAAPGESAAASGL